MFVDDQLQRFKDLFNRLKELRFVRIALLDIGIDFFQIFVRKHNILLVYII